MAKVGHIEVEVKPTVTLESAAACVMMLNLFLDGNDDYGLVCVNRGDGYKWELTDEPKPDLSKTIRDMNETSKCPQSVKDRLWKTR
jgi:hypothetical protein